MVVSVTGLPVCGSTGNEGAAFLDIPVGAGPAALGGAYSALATDAYASVYNPAGLGFTDSVQVAGQHLSYIDTLHYEHAGLVVPMRKSKTSIGASVQYLGSGKVSGLEADGTTPHDYSSYYASYNLSVGHALNEKVAIGVTGKMISAKLDDVSASAYAADLGALYRLMKGLNLSAGIRNLGTKLKFISDGDSLPLTFHAGAAYEPHQRFLVTSEVDYEKAGLASAHVGGQWRPIQMISIRAGYRTDTLKELSALAGFSTGLGINAWGQELAYAWVPYGDLGDTHYISLLIKVGAAAEEKRNLIQYQQIKSHRTVKGREGHESDPEYEQLMQLLSVPDEKIANANQNIGVNP